MGFRVNSNISALNASANLNKTTRSLSHSLEKLSSGLRINKAADDASGLQIADSLQSQYTGLGQAIRNVNDAIGIAQIADKAMDEQIKILNTIKTKAIQAAQSGQTTETRKALQQDITKLMEELDNIAASTSYNGKSLLSGSFTNQSFQIGAYSDEVVKMSIQSTSSDSIGNSRFETAANYVISSGINQLKNVTLKFKAVDGNKDVKFESVKISTSVGTGIGVLTEVINKNSDKTGIRAAWQVMSTGDYPVKEGKIQGLIINGINIGSLEVKKNDNDKSLVNSINSKKDETGVEAFIDNEGKLNLTSVDGRAIDVKTLGLKDNDILGGGSFKRVYIGTHEIQAGTLNNFKINGVNLGTITFLDDDSDETLVNTINSYSNQTGVKAFVDEEGRLNLISDNNVAAVLEADSGLDKIGANELTTDKSSNTIQSGTIHGFTINGVNLGDVDVDTDDANHNLRDTINNFKDETGVEAFVDSGGYLHLVDLEGKGIELDDANGGSDINSVFGGVSPTTEYTLDNKDNVNVGRITLKRHTPQDIIISGINTSAIGLINSTMPTAVLTLRTIKGDFDADVASAIGAHANEYQIGANEGLSEGVTTLRGAMAVIDVADAARKILDKIRADIGSVQNQLTSTINNISVTQVNVKNAESQIRDVDFAEETANFNKNNILAQAGNYALSQANSIQQNVLKLLQ